MSDMNNSITLINKFNLENNRQFYINRAPVQENFQCQHNRLTKNQKLGIQFSTVAGVVGSIALLAKCSKTPYSLSLKSMISTPFKDTFLGKEEYDLAKVLTIGAGSCIGGYMGGMIFDPDKNNRQAKKREALIQYTNISLPIATVAGFSTVGDYITSKIPKTFSNSSSKLKKAISQSPKPILSLVGLGVGIWSGNKAANKLNHLIFKNNDNRPIELWDLSPHLDDVCIASRYINKDNIITKLASRFIPLALIVPGCEIGKKQEICQSIKN